MTGPFPFRISLAEKQFIRKCVYVFAYELLCLF
jgi:hypothetical protein